MYDTIFYSWDAKYYLPIYINNKEYTMEEIDNYFDTIKEFSNKKQIDNLKEKLKAETNDVVRKEIAKKIIEIKSKM